jgi:hypothetical protein
MYGVFGSSPMAGLVLGVWNDDDITFSFPRSLFTVRVVSVPTTPLERILQPKGGGISTTQSLR